MKFGSKGPVFFFKKECYGHWQMTAPTTKDDKLQQYNTLPFGSDELKKHETWIEKFDGIVIGWSSSKIVSGSRALPPRWPPQCSCIVIESSFDPGERLQAPGSFLFYFLFKFHVFLTHLTQMVVCYIAGGHLGGRARLPDTILEEDHPMTIPSNFGSNWATGSREEDFYVNFP
jgi:hypothetical protein